MNAGGEAGGGARRAGADADAALHYVAIKFMRALFWKLIKKL